MSQKVENLQFLSLCRLCLSYTTRPISLISNSKNCEMLETLTRIKVLPNDGISTISCLKCLLNLKLAFSIQQNIIKAEKHFREQLSAAVVKVECLINEANENEMIKVDQKIIIKEEINRLSCKELKGSYVCDICGKEKQTKSLLKSHKYSVHKYETCTICNKKITKTNFRAHIKLHNNKTTIVNKIKVDPLATPEFKQDSNHELFVEAIDKLNSVPLNFEFKESKGVYVCDICGKEKATKNLLRYHRYSVHQYDKCTICKKSVKKTNLQAHLKVHSNKTFVCDICGVSVKHLRTHILYKHKNNGHKCKFCEKTFQHQGSRTCHELRYHNGDYKFTCDFCGKRFYLGANLKTHVARVHLKQKAFLCEICNVNYSSKLSLKTHMRQHTNETPYKCDICSEGFRQKVSLKTHLKSKHQIEEELTCECKECGKMFASKAALIAHGRIH